MLECMEECAEGTPRAAPASADACTKGIPNRFEFIAQIGEGTYGTVFKARDPRTPDGDIVALKKISLDDRDEGVPVTTLREVALLRELTHPNVVRLRELVISHPRIFLVFDYLDQDLKQCLDRRFKEGMPKLLVKSCTLQILHALAYCHLKRVLHRDLKPQNVLIDAAGRVKLADFGLARSFQHLRIRQNYTHEVVTLWYRAPELLLAQQDYDTSIDLWSAGCIFAELSLHQPLFPGNSEIDELFQIFKALGTPTEDLWPGVCALPNYGAIFPSWRPKSIGESMPTTMDAETRDLLERIVVLHPSKRLSAEEALAHPYFEELRHGPLPSLDAFCDDCGRGMRKGAAPGGGITAMASASAPGAAADEDEDEWIVAKTSPARQPLAEARANVATADDEACTTSDWSDPSLAEQLHRVDLEMREGGGRGGGKGVPPPRTRLSNKSKRPVSAKPSATGVATKRGRPQ